nr:hypothetical protein CFP56_00436 [Quercus suber]
MLRWLASKDEYKGDMFIPGSGNRLAQRHCCTSAVARRHKFHVTRKASLTLAEGTLKQYFRFLTMVYDRDAGGMLSEDVVPNVNAASLSVTDKQVLILARCGVRRTSSTMRKARRKISHHTKRGSPGTESDYFASKDTNLV